MTLLRYLFQEKFSHKILNQAITLSQDILGVQELNTDNFDDYITGRKAIVFFYSLWCGEPCLDIFNILNDVNYLLPNSNINIGKINIDKYQSISNKYRIEHVPILLLFNRGKMKE